MSRDHEEFWKEIPSLGTRVGLPGARIFAGFAISVLVLLVLTVNVTILETTRNEEGVVIETEARKKFAVTPQGQALIGVLSKGSVGRYEEAFQQWWAFQKKISDSREIFDAERKRKPDETAAKSPLQIATPIDRKRLEPK